MSANADYVLVANNPNSYFKNNEMIATTFFKI
jgi:hypothetical protein